MVTKIPFISMLFALPASAVTTIASFDLIDDFFKEGGNYTGPGSYDIFDGNTGAVGTDGKIDVIISITTSGLGSDGNGITWAATNDTSNTGLRSIVNPSGSVDANNSGHKACQTITLTFGVGMTVQAQDITNFGWSSGNTAGAVWETSSLEYEVNGAGYSVTVADHGSYGTPGTSGVVGNGYVANSTGTVVGVGTNLSASGSSGSDNGLSTNPVGDMSITNTDVITGLRFIHCLEDVRGVNNSDTVFSATINELELVNVELIPEPSTALLSVFAFLGFLRRQR